ASCYPLSLRRGLARVVPLCQFDDMGSRDPIMKTDSVAVEKHGKRHDSQSGAEEEHHGPHQSATEAQIATIVANDTDASDPHARRLTPAQPRPEDREVDDEQGVPEDERPPDEVALHERPKNDRIRGNKDDQPVDEVGAEPRIERRAWSGCGDAG